MGRHHYGPLYFLLGWALKARYDVEAKIGSLQTPLLIFQGDRDSIVPEPMARRLFGQAKEPKRFHLIRGAGHNDTLEHGGSAYWEEWRRFLAQNVPSPR
ncbi:MAG: alpha/beta hydrolase [Desulfuromonadales bacterium]|nr:alpha/beta hydrolase [Desulfuromonadales bacterium]